jgi:hypothetical protein
VARNAASDVTGDTSSEVNGSEITGLGGDRVLGFSGNKIKGKPGRAITTIATAVGDAEAWGLRADSVVYIPPQSATLSGPSSLAANAQGVFTVTLALEATNNYTVTWFQDGVQVDETEIGANTFFTSISLSWPAAGTQGVSFTISPSVPTTGTPKAVTVGSALPVTQATLYGPASAVQAAVAEFTVVLNQPADQAYTVAWTAASGSPSSGNFVIPLGSTEGNFTTTWAATSTGRAVTFVSITPSTNTAAATITKLGTPKTVPVVAASADTPTTATLTGLTTAEKDRWNVYLVTLDKPADRVYTVQFQQTGPARLYWSSFRIPPGETFAWTMAKWETDPAHAAGSAGSVSFEISPAVTRPVSTISVTVSGTGDAPPSTAFLTGNGLVQAGFARAYTVRLNQIADQDYTVTFSATSGPTYHTPQVITIPTGYASGTCSISWPSAGLAESVSFSISPSTNTSAEALTLIKSPRAVRVVPPFTPELNTRTLDMDRVLQIQHLNGQGKYTRALPNVWMPKVANNEAEFVVASYDTEPDLTFQATSYDLIAYPEGNMSAGVLVARKAVPAGAGTSIFEPVDCTALPSGWTLFEITPTPPTVTQETCALQWMYVGDASAWYFKEWVPVQSGSWAINHEDRGKFRWGRVPAFIDPPINPAPEPTRTFPYFDTTASQSDLYRRNLVAPTVNGDVSFVRPLTEKEGSQDDWGKPLTTNALEGVRSSFSTQGYSFNTLAAETPSVVLRDGPFGVGTIASLTHCEIGTAAPVDANGNVLVIENRYFTDAWSMGKIRKTGEVKRIAGYRHDELAGRILLGDWSRIQAAGKKLGFHETWGLAWDERMFVSDEDHPHIPGERNLRPHPSGILAFVTDSQNGRVLSLKFDRYEHDSPPIVEIFKEFPNSAGAYEPSTPANDTGIHGDPWDCVARQGVLYVSERQRNRVSMWDIDTKAYLGNLIAGPEYQQSGFYSGYGNIGYVRLSDHWIRRTFTKVAGYGSSWTLWQTVPAYVQAPPIIMPEGLYIMDNWLYVGSAVTGCVKRINLDNHSQVEIPFKFQPTSDVANSLYCKVTVSDGTFGPRHTVFAMTWEKDNHSLPFTRLPQTEAQKAAGEPGTPWLSAQAGSLENGRGPEWNSLGYTCGVGQYGGRLLVATADYGMFEISHALSGDVAHDTEKYVTGRVAFDSAGRRLTMGINGFRPWKSVALPWGESEALDYFLTRHGHTP